MRESLWPARIAAIGAVATLIVLNAFQPGGAAVLELASDGLYAATALLGAVLAFLAASRFDRQVPQRRVWSLLGIGLLLWALAELMWTYYQIGVGVGVDVPYPSPADIVWAVGTAPLVLGVFLGHRSLGVRLSPRQRLAATGAYAILLTLLAGGLLVPMFFSQPGVPWAEALLGVYYLIGDLTLAFIATLSLGVLWDGLVGRPWLPIVIGALLFALSDTAFTYAVWIGVYSTGANLLSAAIDVSSLAAYTAIAVGAYRQASLRLPNPTDLHKASASRA
ncbi:MAG: hypothetical protein FJZ97_00045 [Chloroflexi bacterium]|nr:hypothetical protein [Chloroflexota bacterium]